MSSESPHPFGLIQQMKRALKKNKSSNRKVIRLGISCLSFIRTRFRNLFFLFSDTGYRSLKYMQWFKGKEIHQSAPFTCMDRYPVIFTACRDYFIGKQDLKILSFGCSTGEEVLTLRRYFPHARIVGAEINRHSLSLCKKLPVDEKIEFIYSSRREIQKHGKYDAIFCMAVLQ